MPIYLDHAATTPLHPRVAAILAEELSRTGNASSLHLFGRDIRKRVEEAREAIAQVAGAHPTEIVFTGSGTEANNLAIKGFYWSRVAAEPTRNLIVVAAFEHHAILEPVEWLVEHEGAEVSYLPISPTGVVDLAALRELVARSGDRIALVAVMHSNNELGTVQPIREVVELCAGIPVHTDAVQSFGKVPFDFEELSVYSATISAHKIGGPLGIAALILRHGIDLTPLLHGGGQERDLRSGTINAPAIVAFAAAAQIAQEERQDNFTRVSSLRESLKEKIATQVPEARFNGETTATLPGILNVTFPGTETDDLLLLLDNVGIAASTGSACSAGVQQASHVLIALGLSEEDARSSIRFSLGRTTTQAEVDEVGSKIVAVVASAQASYAVANSAKNLKSTVGK